MRKGWCANIGIVDSNCDPDKINYPLLSKRTKLIFYTAWKLANQPERIKLNN